MGYFDAYCNLTRTPISLDDPVYVFIVKKNLGHVNVSITPLLESMCPLEGIYDGYGGVEFDYDDPSSKLFLDYIKIHTYPKMEEDENFLTYTVMQGIVQDKEYAFVYIKKDVLDFLLKDFRWGLNDINSFGEILDQFRNSLGKIQKHRGNSEMYAENLFELMGKPDLCFSLCSYTTNSFAFRYFKKYFQEGNIPESELEQVFKGLLLSYVASLLYVTFLRRPCPYSNLNGPQCGEDSVYKNLTEKVFTFLEEEESRKEID